MPTTVQTEIKKKAAEGVIEGAEVAAPILQEQVKKSLLHSRAAQRSGFITGGAFVVLIYSLIARRRRLDRLEEKLDAVVDEVADDADDADS